MFSTIYTFLTSTNITMKRLHAKSFSPIYYYINLFAVFFHFLAECLCVLCAVLCVCLSWTLSHGGHEKPKQENRENWKPKINPYIFATHTLYLNTMFAAVTEEKKPFPALIYCYIKRIVERWTVNVIRIGCYNAVCIVNVELNVRQTHSRKHTHFFFHFFIRVAHCFIARWMQSVRAFLGVAQYGLYIV